MTEKRVPIVEAYHGYMGSGKNFIARRTRDTKYAGRKVLELAYALSLKTHCRASGVQVEKTAAFRQHIQGVARDTKATHGRYYYADILMENIKYFSEQGIEVFLITDLREKEELARLLDASSRGEIILDLFHIHAPKRTHERLQNESGGNKELYKTLANHPSETALDWDVEQPGAIFTIINNDP